MSAKPKLLPSLIWTFGVTFVAMAAAFVLLSLFNGRSTGPSPLGRTTTMVRAISSALENYQIDNGRYPSDPNTTDRLRPNSDFDPAAYIATSEFLYRVLSRNPAGISNSPGAGKTMCYFDFQPKMLRTSKSGHQYIVDQWGNSFGYSTFVASHPDSKAGNNSTFDLWSTGGGKSAADQSKWIKNW